MNIDNMLPIDIKELKINNLVSVDQVGDLEPTLIPMRISVKGCPIYFQMIGPQPENQNQGPIIR